MKRKLGDVGLLEENTSFALLTFRVFYMGALKEGDSEHKRRKWPN